MIGFKNCIEVRREDTDANMSTTPTKSKTIRACCKNCVYYNPNTLFKGTCNKYTPKPKFPKVKKYDFCGEFGPNHRNNK